MLIYKITNKINSKVYIGQTTKTLRERKNLYYNEYKWSKNPRVIIQAMRKYSFENFDFEIVEDNIQSKELLDERERYYILEVYHSLVKDSGYNVEQGGNGKGKHTEETKKKISDAQKGQLNHMYGKTGSLNVTSKKVIDLTTGKFYGSACEAAKELNLSFSHVCAVARGERGSTGSKVFRYVDESNTPIKPNKTCAIKSKKIIQTILPEFLYLI
jgi:group I intron endonuclease